MERTEPQKQEWRNKNNGPINNIMNHHSNINNSTSTTINDSTIIVDEIGIIGASVHEKNTRKANKENKEDTQVWESTQNHASVSQIINMTSVIFFPITMQIVIQPYTDLQNT